MVNRHSRTIEKKLFDPRQRPWYQAAQTANHDTWTSVYIDFGTYDLVATRSRKVLNSNQEIDGVVATDMPLRALNDFVSNLEISPNGVAFIIEPDGNLIASSCSPNIRQNEAVRIFGSMPATADILLSQKSTGTFCHILHQRRKTLNRNTFFFQSNDKKKIHVAFNKFEDGAGLAVDKRCGTAQ